MFSMLLGVRGEEATAPGIGPVGVCICLVVLAVIVLSSDESY